MFDAIQLDEVGGTAKSKIATDFNAGTHMSYQPHIDYFGNCPRWNLETVDSLQCHQPLEVSHPQSDSLDANNLGSPVLSNEGSTALNLPGEEYLIGYDEKRKAQNRKSQRAFRKRQARYVATLESELQDLRIKYQALLRFFNQIKQAVDVVGQEVCEEEAEPKGNIAEASIDHLLECPDFPL